MVTKLGRNVGRDKYVLLLCMYEYVFWWLIFTELLHLSSFELQFFVVFKNLYREDMAHLLQRPTS